MKKNFNILTAIVLICVVLFFGLWQYEKNNTSELDELCQINIGLAYDAFVTYSQSLSEGDYWYGVGDFKAFMNSWHHLMDESPTEYVWCNEIYGYMVLEPETVQENIGMLIDGMAYLLQDYTHPQGYNLLNTFLNEIKHNSRRNYGKTKTQKNARFLNSSHS